MIIRALISSIVFAYCCAPAESIREFQTSGGLVRIALVSQAQPSDSTIDSLSVSTPVPDSLSVTNGFRTAFMDSSADLTTLFAGDEDAVALLEIYFLEKSTGDELRFPATSLQMHAYLLQHPGEYQAGTRDERAVAMIRDMSMNLHVRMKSPVAGVGK